MSAPITHIALAEKFFSRHGTDKNRREFFVGTSFPDFRYFDNLERQTTHFRGVTLAEIKKLDSFAAGLKFHSLVDELWEKFFTKQPDYPFVLEPKHLTGLSLKFLEDEIYYRWVKDWPEVIGFLDKIFPKELEMDDSSSAEEIEAWHKILADYFSQAPDDESRRKFLRSSEINDDLAGELNQFVANLRGNQRALAVIGEFYDYFCRQVGFD